MINFTQKYTYRLMFSIILNCPPVVLNLGTDPGLITLISWHNTWPSLMYSSNGTFLGNFLPNTASIHSWASFSCWGSRLEANYKLIHSRVILGVKILLRYAKIRGNNIINFNTMSLLVINIVQFRYRLCNVFFEKF